MRIAICEDSQLDRGLLVDVVGHYAAQRSRAIQVTAYDGGLGLVRDMEDGGYYDLVFLDNLMDDMLGIQVARRLRELNYQGPLVFISSTDAYAVAGYEVSAAAYLLKPYDYPTVAAVLDKFLPETGPEERYAIRRRAAVIQLPYQDILFVESQNAKCILHCRDGQTHVVYKTPNTVAHPPAGAQAHPGQLSGLSGRQGAGPERGGAAALRQARVTKSPLA